MTSKSELRKHMASMLTKLSEESRQQQSREILRKVLAHPEYKKAKNISIYLSTAREIDTIGLLRHALETDEKKCFIPYITDKLHNGGDVSTSGPRMRMIELSSMNEFEQLPVNKYGIKEPKEDFASQQTRFSFRDDNLLLHLVIVPGVAFSRDGRRLGHGKGYYDEFLGTIVKNLHASKWPYTLGLALREQIVDDPLAVEGHDYILDEVLTA